jgi:NADPH:quinone reductase-like Zn-dependent oxidoreductase
VRASLNRSFDIVFDTNGSLTPAQGDALTKRGGVVVDANPSAGKFMRSLLSRRRKVVMSVPTAKILQEVADLAGKGKLPISIGRVARFIAVIGPSKRQRGTGTTSPYPSVV